MTSDRPAIQIGKADTSGAGNVTRSPTPERRALLLAELRTAIRAAQEEERLHQLRRGTTQPRTTAEQAIFDEGAARRAKRLARRRARAQAARTEAEAVTLT